MKPFITYKKELFIVESSYSLFNRIDKLNLKEGVFRKTYLDLTSEVLHSDPLIIGFKSSTSVLGYNLVYLNPKLQAEFLDKDQRTKVVLEIKSSPFWLIPAGVLLFVFLEGLFSNSLSGWSIFFYVAVIGAILGIDLFLKYSLLTRVEKLIVG